jgi:hypothetical protein
MEKQRNKAATSMQDAASKIKKVLASHQPI